MATLERGNGIPKKTIGQGSSYDTLAAGQLHESFLVFKYDILYIKLA